MSSFLSFKISKYVGATAEFSFKAASYRLPEVCKKEFSKLYLRSWKTFHAVRSDIRGREYRSTFLFCHLIE